MRNKIFNIVTFAIFVLVISFISIKIIGTRDAKYFMYSSPQRMNIEKHYKFSGKVYPVKEIELKSQLSGVLEELYVKTGDMVKKGDTIALIKMVPSSSNIEQLEANVRRTLIELEAQSRSYERAKKLYKESVIPIIELESEERSYLVRKEEYNAACAQLDILKSGNVRGKDKTNIVVATEDGIIIDIPIITGESVIERNNYNVGTTIAYLAQMDEFVFKASVAERYLKYLNIGTNVSLSFAADDSLIVNAAITKIASKGLELPSGTKFPIEATFQITSNTVELRSGYTAIADIILEKAINVIAIEEKNLHFSSDSIFVYLPDSSNLKKPLSKVVAIGLSDGLMVEIKDGITINDKIITNYD